MFIPGNEQQTLKARYVPTCVLLSCMSRREMRAGLSQRFPSARDRRETWTLNLSRACVE